MKDKLFQAWEEAEYDRMISILRLYLDQNTDRYDNDIHKVIKIKYYFESDLPNRVVAESVGCDIELCRRIRWRGNDYGVVDTWGQIDRNSIPPSMRREILERDGGCVKCGETNDELQPHHIIPVSHGGVNHESNLAMLCKPCHKEAHGGDFSSRRAIYDGKSEFWRDFAGTEPPQNES